MALALKYFGSFLINTPTVADIRAPTVTEAYNRVIVSNQTAGAIVVTLYVNKAAGGDREFGDTDVSIPAKESRDWGLCILQNGDKLRGKVDTAAIYCHLMGFVE